MGNDGLLPDVAAVLTRNALRVNELAAAMIDNAVTGKGSETVGNMELRRRGKSILKGRK